jgi:hypothetical protein
VDEYEVVYRRLLRRRSGRAADLGRRHRSPAARGRHGTAGDDQDQPMPPAPVASPSPAIVSLPVAARVAAGRGS